jgi:hypothetical protein
VSTPLDFLFEGSPEGPQTLIEIKRAYDDTGKPFGEFVKWRQLRAGIWAMTVETLAHNRPKIVFILATQETGDNDVLETIKDVSINSLPLYIDHRSPLEHEQQMKMQHSCIDICDRVFVINIGEIDNKTQLIIDYAEQIGRQVVYLRY